MFKVIEQAPQVAPVAPIPYHGASSAASVASAYSYAQSYAAGYGYGGSSHSHSHSHSGGSNYNEQLNAILPQIIQLVLQEDSLGGGGGGGYGNIDDINGQLINTFGRKGKAIIMRADQAQGAFFKSGHVVQRGTLKVMRVQDQQQQKSGGGGGGASGGGWSSGGSSSSSSSGGWSSGGASSGGWSSAQPAGW